VLTNNYIRKFGQFAINTICVTGQFAIIEKNQKRKEIAFRKEKKKREQKQKKKFQYFY
jgi:hypothetical protein